jgi:cell division protein FtsL
MRDSVMWFLVSSVVVTSLFTVYVRHQHRIAYYAFQTEESRRDALVDEWGQLLIEENLWAFPHRIEKDASDLLSMRAPTAKDVEFVGLFDVTTEKVNVSK